MSAVVPKTGNTGMKNVHVDLIVTAEMKDVRSRTAPADENHNPESKTIIMRLQIEDLLAGRRIACAKCKNCCHVMMLYRCRFCGVWYCAGCADVHFGRHGKPVHAEVE